MLPGTPITSFEAAGLIQESAPASDTPISEPARPVRVNVREGNGQWGGTLDLGTFLNSPGYGLFAGQTGLDPRWEWWPADRVQLPNHSSSGILTEPQWRALLTWSRWLCERNMLAIGFWNQVSNFIGQTTVGWVRQGASPGAVADGGADDDPLVREVTAYWEEWRKAAGWGCGMDDRQRECRRRLLRDGEVILRLGEGDHDRDFLPWVRFVEPEQVRLPTISLDGLTRGDWSWGVCTKHGDVETILAYWIAYVESGGAVGEEVDPRYVLHLKDNVDRTIKRGFPSFTPTETLLQTTLAVLANLGTTSKAQSAIAWIEQYATATPEAIRDVLNRQSSYQAQVVPGGAAGANMNGGGLIPTGVPGSPRVLPVRYNPAGTVIHADQNRQYNPGPVSEGIPTYLQMVDATLKAVGWRFGIPDWFTQGAQAFAAALVTGSPFAREIKDRQGRFIGLTEELSVRVVRMGEESGRLPVGAHRQVKPVVTAEPVVIADEQKQATVDDLHLKNFLVDPQTIIREAGRDPKVVIANIKAWRKETAGLGGPGDQPPAGPGGPSNPGPGPAGGGPGGGKDPTPVPPGSAGGDQSESLGDMLARESAHDYSSMHLPLGGEVADRLLAMGRAIRKDDLAEKGVEAEPHVTIRYGLETDDVEPIRDALRYAEPVRLRLGRVSVLPGAETGKAYDVLKVDVESPELRRLHGRLAAVPHTDTHHSYNPHATIGYLKAGLGEKYARLFAPLDTEITVGEVVFSDRERRKTVIPLGEAAEGYVYLDDTVRALVMEAAGLVEKEVEVHRGGKTFKQKRLVRSGEQPTADKAPTPGTLPAGVPTAAETTPAVLADLATAFPAEAKDPRVWDRVKAAAGKVHEAVYGAMLRLTPHVLPIAEAVLETPDDFARLGYRPGLGGVGVAGGDPIQAHLGISTHLFCSLASKALAHGLVWAKSKLTKTAESADTVTAAADWVTEFLVDLNKNLGLDVPIDREAVAALVRGKTVQLREKTGAVDESDPGPAGIVVQEGYTGMLTDSRGREYHYVNGRRVKGTQAAGHAERHAATEAAVARAIADPAALTPDHVAELAGHLGRLTKDRLQDLARQVRQRVGGTNAALADRLLAHVLSERAGQPTPGQPLEQQQAGTRQPEKRDAQPDRPQPAPAPAGAPPAGSVTGPPKPPQDVRVRMSQQAKTKARALFGTRAVAATTLAAAANAGDGAKLTVDEHGFHRDGIRVATEGDGYTANRSFYRDRTGDLVVHNDYFAVKYVRDPGSPGPPPDWKKANPAVNGTELLANQVRALRAMGVKKIETHAARSDSANPNHAMNGYYTWPRLGYDAEIPDDEYGKLPPDLKAQVESNPTGSRTHRSVLDLMATEAGRTWWKENGTDLLDATFDLSDGSLSMRTLEKYLGERGKKG